ncbi:hypothetical protein [Paenibacillus macerans]|uniref:hypothetical protein n=1 Tax=Paenibacillus macerans TaxID=44252 RepID=UPI003D31C79F
MIATIVYKLTENATPEMLKRPSCTRAEALSFSKFARLRIIPSTLFGLANCSERLRRD